MTTTCANDSKIVFVTLGELFAVPVAYAAFAILFMIVMLILNEMGYRNGYQSTRRIPFMIGFAFLLVVVPTTLLSMKAMTEFTWIACYQHQVVLGYPQTRREVKISVSDVRKALLIRHRNRSDTAIHLYVIGPQGDSYVSSPVPLKKLSDVAALLDIPIQPE